MALSSDARILAVGGPENDVSRGATWIFVLDSLKYQPLGSKLVGSGSVGPFVNQGKFFCFFLQSTVFCHTLKNYC